MGRVDAAVSPHRTRESERLEAYRWRGRRKRDVEFLMRWVASLQTSAQVMCLLHAGFLAFRSLIATAGHCRGAAVAHQPAGVSVGAESEAGATCSGPQWEDTVLARACFVFWHHLASERAATKFRGCLQAHACAVTQQAEAIDLHKGLGEAEALARQAAARAQAAEEAAERVAQSAELQCSLAAQSVAAMAVAGYWSEDNSADWTGQGPEAPAVVPSEDSLVAAEQRCAELRRQLAEAQGELQTLRAEREQAAKPRQVPPMAAVAATARAAPAIALPLATARPLDLRRAAPMAEGGAHAATSRSFAEPASTVVRQSSCRAAATSPVRCWSERQLQQPWLGSMPTATVVRQQSGLRPASPVRCHPDAQKLNRSMQAASLAVSAGTASQAALRGSERQCMGSFAGQPVALAMLRAPVEGGPQQRRRSPSPLVERRPSPPPQPLRLPAEAAPQLAGPQAGPLLGLMQGQLPGPGLRACQPLLHCTAAQPPPGLAQASGRCH